MRVEKVFPEKLKTPDEYYLYTALAHDILVVAHVEPTFKTWAAYIAPVNGRDHEEEWKRVVPFGDKVDKELAEFLFHDIPEECEWRP